MTDSGNEIRGRGKPTDVSHRHGAAKDSRFLHLGLEGPDVDAGIVRLDPVTDEEYLAL